MGVNLQVIIGYLHPLDETALLQLPERLASPVFEREALRLLEAAAYGGFQTATERAKFCSWTWREYNSIRRWYGWRSPRNWSEVVDDYIKRGRAPQMAWAGFSATIHRRCLRMRHIEKYGGFLRGKRYGLPPNSGLRKRLRRCCLAVAEAFGTRRALYVPDCGSEASSAGSWASADEPFDAIEANLHSILGPPPSRWSDCDIEGYMLDTFDDIAL